MVSVMDRRAFLPRGLKAERIELVEETVLLGAGVVLRIGRHMGGTASGGWSSSTGTNRPLCRSICEPGAAIFRDRCRGRVTNENQPPADRVRFRWAESWMSG